MTPITIDDLDTAAERLARHTYDRQMAGRRPPYNRWDHATEQQRTAMLKTARRQILAAAGTAQQP